MKKTIQKMLMLVCLLVAVMGLSIVTAHAATVTGTISGGNEYRYHEDKTPVPQWGAFTSTKLKYFTRDDTGVTVPAYCMEPSVRSAGGDLSYSSTSWSSLSWNQRYAVTLALSYGYGGNYDFYGIHPDCAQLATQAVIWEFVCGYLDEELQLAEQMFPPPEAEEVKRLLQSRAELSDVRRAAAIYKLQRYSYNGNGDSYGVSSCDIQRFFRDIWECSHRLKDVALENKDFESIITTHNDPQTTVYCDPPYYEAERYAVEFPRSDHQRLHDVLAQHRGFAMVSYNNCDYIRRLYEDFFIYEVERPNSQSKKKNDIYREYIMTNYDPRVFASQMTIFGDYSSDGKICRLMHIPERPLRT